MKKSPLWEQETFLAFAEGHARYPDVFLEQAWMYRTNMPTRSDFELTASARECSPSCPNCGPAAARVAAWVFWRKLVEGHTK